MNEECDDLGACEGVRVYGLRSVHRRALMTSNGRLVCWR